jgi:hypothetical protein
MIHNISYIRRHFDNSITEFSWNSFSKFMAMENAAYKITKMFAVCSEISVLSFPVDRRSTLQFRHTKFSPKSQCQSLMYKQIWPFKHRTAVIKSEISAKISLVFLETKSPMMNISRSRFWLGSSFDPLSRTVSRISSWRSFSTHSQKFWKQLKESWNKLFNLN